VTEASPSGCDRAAKPTHHDPEPPGLRRARLVDRANGERLLHDVLFRFGWRHRKHCAGRAEHPGASSPIRCPKRGSGSARIGRAAGFRSMAVQELLDRVVGFHLDGRGPECDLASPQTASRSAVCGRRYRLHDNDTNSPAISVRGRARPWRRRRGSEGNRPSTWPPAMSSGVLGADGAGKSTTWHAATTFRKADVRAPGASLRTRRRDRRASQPAPTRGVFQDTVVDGPRRVRRNFDIHAPALACQRRRREPAPRELADSFGPGRPLDRPSRPYSCGQRRARDARRSVSEPRVLFLDDPPSDSIRASVRTHRRLACLLSLYRRDRAATHALLDEA